MIIVYIYFRLVVSGICRIVQTSLEMYTYSDVTVFFLDVQGWFSPGQVFVLDEYCARYGVRGCHRHLCYLKDLMDFSENNALVDPTLLHYSYAFCASHVHGNRYQHSVLLLLTLDCLFQDILCNKKEPWLKNPNLNK